MSLGSVWVWVWARFRFGSVRFSVRFVSFQLGSGGFRWVGFISGLVLAFVSSSVSALVRR